MSDLQQQIKELDWCLHSEPLIQGDDRSLWPDASWFAQWSLPRGAGPTPAVRDKRLGARFESLIVSWISAEPALELLARNLQVNGDGRTLGEFDLIVNNSGVIEHWEVAVKFYLGTRNRDSLGNWVGPDPSDTLARKIDRMRNHQLRLSQTSAGCRLLIDNQWNVRQVRSLVKGRLYHPRDSLLSDAVADVVPDAVNPNHERGWWMSLEHFCGTRPPSDQRFMMLDKRYWLAPVSGISEQETHDYQGIVRELIDASHAGTRQLAVIDPAGRELSRGFVVYPRWLKDVGL